MPAINSKYEKFALMASVLETTQKLVIPPCCFAEDS